MCVGKCNCESTRGTSGESEGVRQCLWLEMQSAKYQYVRRESERVRASHLYLNRGEVPLARSLKLYKALLYILYTFKIRNFRRTGPPLLVVVLSPLVYTLPDNAALCCAAAFWAALLQASRSNGKMQRRDATSWEEAVGGGGAGPCIPLLAASTWHHNLVRFHTTTPIRLCTTPPAMPFPPVLLLPRFSPFLAANVCSNGRV